MDSLVLKRKDRKGILMIVFAILVSFAFFFLPANHVLAQDREPTDDEVNAIAKQLYCPVCENTPLDVCPTQACAQWRATIKEKLSQDWTEQQIKDYFVAQYGERVLAHPSARGFNLALWVLAPLGIATAVSLFVFYLRRLQKPASIPATAASAENGEYTKRLEEELKKRR